MEQINNTDSKNIDISVIIPAYNAENTLHQCLSGLAAQTIPAERYEVILVDDGSTDQTRKIAEQFDVTYIFQKNQGPAAARNRGVESARGSIILFTDSDCIPLPAWIEEMTGPFSDPDVIAVKGAYITNQKSPTARFAQVEFEERYNLLLNNDYIDMIDTYSAAFRKPVFLSFGGFDPSFPVANNEDTDLSYKMSTLGKKMVFNPNAIVEHLNHPACLKRYATLKFSRGYWRMIVYKRYPDKMMKDSYTPQTLKLQILFLFMALLCLFSAVLMWKIFWYPFFLFFLLFCLVSLPFILLAIQKDFITGMTSPFFIAIRAASLGLGACWGIVSRTR